MNVKNFAQFWSETGKTLYLIVRRSVDGYLLNNATGDFSNSPASPYVAATEDPVMKGRYYVAEGRAVWNDGAYEFYFYRQTGGAPAPAVDTPVGSGNVTIAADKFAAAAIPGDAMTLTPSYDAAKSAAQAGDAMALTNGERASLATVIEGHLLNDADGQALLQAIVNKINATDVDLAGLSVTAIASASASAILAVPGNKLTTDGTGRVTVGTVEDKSGYALTADYDRAKAAAAPEEIPTPNAVATSVWSSPLRTLTGFGTLVADVVAGVWNAAARTLTAFAFPVTATEITDKTGYALTASYDAAKTAASQQTVDTAAQAIMTAITTVATDEDMQTLLARLTDARAMLIDKLAIPTEQPGPVVVISRPIEENLQVLWGIAKELGRGWAEGDTVTVTPVGKNQHPGGYLLPLIPKTAMVAADGTFSIEVDKGAQVIVEVGNYYSKTITLSQEDACDLSTY